MNNNKWIALSLWRNHGYADQTHVYLCFNCEEYLHNLIISLNVQPLLWWIPRRTFFSPFTCERKIRQGQSLFKRRRPHLGALPRRIPRDGHLSKRVSRVFPGIVKTLRNTESDWYRNKENSYAPRVPLSSAINKKRGEIDRHKYFGAYGEPFYVMMFE